MAGEPSERGGEVSRGDFSLSGWQKRLEHLGFSVKTITKYPEELRKAQQSLPPQKRPFELSGLSDATRLGTVLDAELDGYRIILQPPDEGTSLFAVNVFNTSGRLVMSNHDYSPPEFFDGLRRNMPVMAKKIPHDPAAAWKDLFFR